MLALAARLWFWAAIVRPLKHVVPLGTLVHLVHRPPRTPPDGRRVEQVQSLLKRTGRVPRRAPGNCLERSLGAYRLLCAAGAAPQIVVGVRRGAGTRVDGHVWLMIDGRPLAEDEAFLAGFSRVLTFGPDGRQTSGAAGGMPEGVRLS